MEITKDKRQDLLAATASLEAKKVLFSLFARLPGLCLVCIDVTRAYFHAKASRRAHVDLPVEGHQDSICGRPKKATYGTGDAAQNWELEYSETMTEVGFTQGSYSACVFDHKEKDVRAVVRGDDFQYLDQGVIWIGFVKSFNVART